MKKIFFTLSLISIFLASCKNDCIEDSGQHIEKKTTVKAFDKIEVSGGIILLIRQDSSYQVKAATDSNLMQQLKVDVSGSSLILKMKDRPYCGKDSVFIEVGIGQLKELTVDGSVKVRTEGKIYADRVALNAAGSNDITLDLHASALNSTLDGVTAFHLSGQSGSHNLSIKGNADVKAFDFISGAYNVDISGSAKADINVLNELFVKTEGSSDIHYKGNPTKVNEKKSGAATLEKVK